MKIGFLPPNEEKVQGLHSGFLQGLPADAESLPLNLMNLYPYTPSLALWRLEEILAYGSCRRFSGLTLDLGCGDGAFFHAGFRATGAMGIDSNPDVLLRAKSKGCYSHVFSAHGEYLPFRSESFDYVFSNCVLEHTWNPGRVFAEVERVLKPGGALLCSALTKESEKWFFPSRFLNLFGFRKRALYVLQRFNELQEHRNVLSQEGWRQAVEKSGLRLIRYKAYMEPKRYYVFSFFDWVWNYRNEQKNKRLGNVLESFLANHAWIRGRLYGFLKRVMESKRISPQGAGLIILADKP